MTGQHTGFPGIGNYKPEFSNGWKPRVPVFPDIGTPSSPTAYAYDLLDRATNITYTADDGSLIRSLDYAYDSASMITNKVIVDDASSFFAHAYEYDSINRLVGESRTTGGTTFSSSYAYDLAGNRYGFQGREIDWGTGLYYFRARWYNPETGHWLSKDPIGISGGLNLYAFCGNNPVMFVDPDGEDFKSWAKGAAVAAQMAIQVAMQETGPKVVRMASKGKAVSAQIAKKIGPKGASAIGGILTLVMTPTTVNAGEADWIFRRQMEEQGWVEREPGVFYPPEKPEC